MGIDHKYTKNIICPYCGYEDHDCWEIRDNDGEVNCGRCDEEFNYERIVTVEYTTTKKRCTEHNYVLRKDYPKHFSNRTSDYSTGKLQWKPIPEDEYQWYRCESCSVCQHERLVEISQAEFTLI